MEDFVKKISVELKKIKLDTNERISARENLLLFMKENPLKVNEPVKKYQPVKKTSVRSPYVPDWLSSVRRLPFRSIAIVLLFAVTGVSYAANGALPGDFLYSVKIGINENIRSAFTFGLENEAAYSVALLDRRLSEGEALAVEKKLGRKESTYLLSRVEENSSDIKAKVNEFQSAGKYDTALTVSTSAEIKLKLHQAVLSELAIANTDSIDNDVSTFLFSIESKAEDMRNIKKSVATTLVLKGDATIESSALAKLKSAEEQLAYAEKKSPDSAGAVITPTAETRTMMSVPVETPSLMLASDVSVVTPESKIRLARNLYDEGNKLFQEGDYASAYVLFGESSKLIEESKLMEEFSEKFNFSVVIHDDTYQNEIIATRSTTTSDRATTSTPVITPKSPVPVKKDQSLTAPSQTATSTIQTTSTTTKKIEPTIQATSSINLDLGL